MHAAGEPGTGAAVATAHHLCRGNSPPSCVLTSTADRQGRDRRESRPHTAEEAPLLKEVKSKLEAEITTLDFELRVTLPKEIKKALEHGDLRENSEYKSALERQEYVRARLGQLKKRLSELSTIDVTRLPKDRIAYGSTVTVENEPGRPASSSWSCRRRPTPRRAGSRSPPPSARAWWATRKATTSKIVTPGGTKRWTITAMRTIHEDA